MKAFVAALVVMIAIGFGTYSVLDGKFQKSADQAFVTTGARIDTTAH